MSVVSLAVPARTADRLFRSARREDAGAQRLFEVANAVPGIGLRVDASALAVLAWQPGVVAVTPLSQYTARNASAGQLTRVLTTWRRVRETGRGVTIGIVDTGLDYTHADFGGPGTPAAYQAAAADETDGEWRAGLPALARRKVVGGFDLAGPWAARSPPSTIPSTTFSTRSVATACFQCCPSATRGTSPPPVTRSCPPSTGPVTTA